MDINMHVKVEDTEWAVQVRPLMKVMEERSAQKPNEGPTSLIKVSRRLFSETEQNGLSKIYDKV